MSSMAQKHEPLSGPVTPANLDSWSFSSSVGLLAVIIVIAVVVIAIFVCRKVSTCPQTIRATMVFFGCPPMIVKFKPPTSQNLEVEQQIWIFGIRKSRFTNVFMIELMHQEQTSSSIA
jgi:hypothetical protein